MNNYPYPVLSDDGSAYKDDCTFTLQFEKSEITEEAVILYYTVDLKSNYLKSLIDEGFAKAIIRIKSGIYVKSFNADLNGNRTVLSIGSENFQANDTIAATAYVIAIKPFNMKWNEEFVDLFEHTLSVSIRKNDVLAESGREILNYNLRNNDFIQFKPSDEQNGKGVKISLSDPNYINIIIGTDMNAAYTKKKSDNKINTIFASHIVFETFIYVLCEVISNQDEYSSLEWYRLLDQLFLTTGESIDDFKAKAFSDRIDMSQVFEKSQELIGNAIEMSLISISAEEGD